VREVANDHVPENVWGQGSLSLGLRELTS
jgi:hypothetical protein